jgi:hypothetical protein
LTKGANGVCTAERGPAISSPRSSRDRGTDGVAEVFVGDIAHRLM